LTGKYNLFFTIGIPAYSMRGKGHFYLERAIRSIYEQYYSDKYYEILVSDDSDDDIIYKVYKSWKDRINIRYIKNENDKGAGNNFNNLLLNAKGEYIKLLCQDDTLFDNNSLNIIEKIILDNKNYFWYAFAYAHILDNKVEQFRDFHYPSYNQDIVIVNTIGTPSCVTIRNMYKIPLFDNNLKYYYDCEWYHRLVERYGQPYLSNEITMKNYINGEESSTSQMTAEIIGNDLNYIYRKYRNG
jgi:glycosyltransferase involved in cell wall biosynthesis